MIDEAEDGDEATSEACTYIRVRVKVRVQVGVWARVRVRVGVRVMIPARVASTSLPYRVRRCSNLHDKTS